MLGCVGPFGIIDPHHEDRVEYKILHLNEYICQKQNVSCTCGVI